MILVQLFFGFFFSFLKKCVPSCVYLSACPAQPCCGDGSCVFPACRGGHVEGRKGGVEGEASAGPGCGGSEGRGPQDGTLEETPQWSCMNWLLQTDSIYIPLI